jgi:hypothetical protein
VRYGDVTVDPMSLFAIAGDTAARQASASREELRAYHQPIIGVRSPTPESTAVLRSHAATSARPTTDNMR